MKAKFTGVCPLCSTYIAKGRSKVEALPEPMVPRGNGVRSSDDHGLYHASRRPISMHPRVWAHERCVRRYESVG